MKLRSLTVLSLSLLGTNAMRGADATAPVDYTQRNAPFAPAATVTPEKKELPRADAVQDRRVEKATVVRAPAAVGERRAAISVEEARAKEIRDKSFSRPETVEQPMSRFNRREASIATSADTKTPPLVTKYQESLAAASASNMARFPALDRATTVKINRFVFLKNPDEPAGVAAGATVTPAGGANPVRK